MFRCGTYAAILLMATACVPHSRLNIISDNRTYSIGTDNHVDYFIWAHDTKTALDAADRELRCDRTPCIIDSYGIVLRVYVPN